LSEGIPVRVVVVKGLDNVDLKLAGTMGMTGLNFDDFDPRQSF
jgi:hypothetical protein